MADRTTEDMLTTAGQISHFAAKGAKLGDTPEAFLQGCREANDAFDGKATNAEWVLLALARRGGAPPELRMQFGEDWRGLCRR